MKKNFDAVAFQRKNREKLGKAFLKNRKAFIAQVQKAVPKTAKKAA